MADTWFILKDKRSLPGELAQREENVVENLPEIEMEYRRNVMAAVHAVLHFPEHVDRMAVLTKAGEACVLILDMFPLKKAKVVYRDVSMMLTCVINTVGIELPKD